VLRGLVQRQPGSDRRDVIGEDLCVQVEDLRLAVGFVLVVVSARWVVVVGCVCAWFTLSTLGKEMRMQQGVSRFAQYRF
jgi:hypothetical protein